MKLLFYFKEVHTSAQTVPIEPSVKMTDMDLTETDGYRTGSDIRFHNDISPGSPSQVELYHKLIHDNKKLIYEIKIGIISVIGSIIILVCLIYIAIQCKRSSSKLYNTYMKNRRPDLKASDGLNDSTENLLQGKTHISIKKKHDKEFFVWQILT